ncbi:hypothetical protein EV426DRAFT_507422, partial [Tirmania nivea]
SNCPQMSAAMLMIGSCRLGSDRGTAVMSVSQLFSIAEGTVVLYTKRVMIALNTCWNEVTKWHTPEERKQMKKRLRDSGFEDCVDL